MTVKYKRGLGNVHRNINCRVFGINPYNTFKYIDTPFGRFIFITHSKLEEIKETNTPNKRRHICLIS